jgi:epoxyqueuosine reductase
MPSLGDADLLELRAHAESLGLFQLGAASLDHPAFEPARRRLAEFLGSGKAGEMQFMSRTAQVRARPEQMLEGARSVLVAVVPYDGEPGPVARYAQWSDYHTELHRKLARLAESVEARCPGVQSLACVDTKPLLERTAAVAAGLGFLGKNGCLIVPGFGSTVLIGSLLTTAEWSGADACTIDPRHDPFDACGQCTACLDACPTDAFDAPGKLDPRNCISYLTIEHRGPIDPELRSLVGVRIVGCDVCQEVCPYNHGPGRAAKLVHAAWLPKPSGRDRTPNLAKLANIGNNQHRGFVRGTPVNRIPRRALRRNAIIALGNRVARLDEEELEALRRAAAEADGELAELARWALGRRGAEPAEER